MNLAILSRSNNCYSTQRLCEAAERRGKVVQVLDTLKFSIDSDRGEPDLFYHGQQLPDFDAVLPRIGASVTYFGTAVVRQFEQMDVFCANSSSGISNSRDKLRSLQILSRHNIGIPKTAFVRSRSDVLPAIERIGGAPVIIKLLEGTQGVGVILADKVSIAEAIIETLQSTKQNVLLQKFVSESKGRDIRAFVIGDRVVAAIRRVAQGQEFRSNVHRGGKAEPVILDDTYCQTAIRATQIMGLRIAGVDMLEGRDGPPSHGNQFLARTGGNRVVYAARYRRGHYRLHRRPDRFSGNRFTTTPDCQPWLWSCGDLHSGRFRVYWQNNR